MLTWGTWEFIVAESLRSRSSAITDGSISSQGLPSLVHSLALDHPLGSLLSVWDPWLLRGDLHSWEILLLIFISQAWAWDQLPTATLCELWPGPCSSSSSSSCRHPPLAWVFVSQARWDLGKPFSPGAVLCRVAALSFFFFNFQNILFYFILLESKLLGFYFPRSLGHSMHFPLLLGWAAGPWWSLWSLHP